MKKDSIYCMVFIKKAEDREAFCPISTIYIPDYIAVEAVVSNIPIFFGAYGASTMMNIGKEANCQSDWDDLRNENAIYPANPNDFLWFTWEIAELLYFAEVQNISQIFF